MTTYIYVSQKETKFKFGGVLFCKIATLKKLAEKYCLPEYGGAKKAFKIMVYEEAMEIEGTKYPASHKPKGENVVYAYDLSKIFKTYKEVYGIGDIHF